MMRCTCGRVFGIKPFLVVLNLYLGRLHHITVSHDKTHSNRWCQWTEIFRLRPHLSKQSTYRTVNFCNRDIGLEELYWTDPLSHPNYAEPKSSSVTRSKFPYEQSTSSRVTDGYFHSLKPVLIHRSTDQQSNTLIIRTLGKDEDKKRHAYYGTTLV